MPNLPVQNEILLEYLKVFSIFPELNKIEIDWENEFRHLLNFYIVKGFLDHLQWKPTNNSILQRCIKANNYWQHTRGDLISWEKLIGTTYIKSVIVLTKEDVYSLYLMLSDFPSEYVQVTTIHTGASNKGGGMIRHIVHVDTPNIEKAILDLEKQYV